MGNIITLQHADSGVLKEVQMTCFFHIIYIQDL